MSEESNASNSTGHIGHGSPIFDFVYALVVVLAIAAAAADVFVWRP